MRSATGIIVIIESSNFLHAALQVVEQIWFDDSNYWVDEKHNYMPKVQTSASRTKLQQWIYIYRLYNQEGSNIEELEIPRYLSLYH